MNSFQKDCSARIQSVQSPIIPTIAAKIRETPGTISLGQGVVYYGPPAQALERMKASLQNPTNNIYGEVQGSPELRQAIAGKLVRENRVELDGSALVVSAGSNMAFYNAVLAISEPGDEVIIAHPYYFNHEMAITMAGCKPVAIPVDNDYQLGIESVTAAVNDHTKAIVTISPNNPTGAIYPEDTLRSINNLCRERGIYHISDEAYEYFVYGSKKHFSPGSIPGASAHTLSLYSLSKSYGFAGWRIGYMVVPVHLLDAIVKIQDTVLICPTMVSQTAAIGALDAGVAYCETKMTQIRSMRAEVLNRLTDLGDLAMPVVSDGAFYVLLNLRKNIDDLALVDRLIRRYRVAVIPGSAFGITQGCYLRIAYGALDPKSVEEGMNRLVNGIQELISGPY